MTRAVTLAEIAEGDILNIDGTNNRIGIGTTNPQALLQVGAGVSVYGNSGIVSATKYYGSGANLTGITAGATLSAGSGAQRVVVTSLTSGTMTSAATDAELTYNSTSNTLSATTFSGALTGNATGLTGTPDITVRNIIGVGATLSGVVTYEDVTNIDSAGLVTARTGVKVLAGGINVVGVSTISTGVGTVHVGVGSTALLVEGDARVTGILTIGQGSITLDPTARKIEGIDEIIIGTGTTVRIHQDSSGEIAFSDRQGKQASVGIGTTVSINTTGIITAATL